MKNLVVLAASALFCLAFVGSATAAEQAGAASMLNNGDCVKCHSSFVQQINEGNSKHKTDVGCLDCHEGKHPPGVEKRSLIPQCSKCHEGESHFTLDNCMGCHSNPHQPLNIAFKGKVKAACNTCHSDQVQEVDTHPSAHAKVDCSFCHVKHGFIPNCLTECHEPHRAGQTFEDCVSCHKVHQPLPVTYGESVANSHCGACHGDLQQQLESGSTKHAALQCAFCHKETHGMRPACTDCHGKPHPDSMMSKFKNCVDCHVDPHNLTK